MVAVASEVSQKARLAEACDRSTRAWMSHPVTKICLFLFLFPLCELKVCGHFEVVSVNEETKKESLLRSPFSGLMNSSFLYPNF